MVVDSSADLLQTSFHEDPFLIGDNNQLLQAEHFDLGGQGVAYHDIDSINRGKDYRINESVDIQTTQDVNGNYNLGWLRSGEWIEYTTDVIQGTYDINLRVASLIDSPGSLSIKLDDELLSKVTITGTDGWQNWQTVSIENVRLSGGEDRVLRLEVNDGGKFNLNWLEFQNHFTPINEVAARNSTYNLDDLENRSTPINEVVARSTDDFIDSIGVIVQVGHTKTAYGQFDEIVKPRLEELGVRHLRTNINPNEKKNVAKLEELAELGIEFNFVMDPNRLSLSESVELVEMFGDSVESVEGPNEWNHSRTQTYQGQNFPEGLSNYQSDLYQAIKSDPDTAHIPVIAPSMSNGVDVKSHIPELGTVDADFNNAHHYPFGKHPYKDALFSHLSFYEGLAGPEKPLIITETGYTNTPTYERGVSEEAAGIYLPRLLMVYFNLGIERTYMYELLNERFDPTNRTLNFGLLRADGSKKPSFVAVENLIDILDSSDVAATSAVVPLGSLDYSIEGNTKNIHQTLLQKRWTILSNCMARST